MLSKCYVSLKLILSLHIQTRNVLVIQKWIFEAYNYKRLTLKALETFSPLS